MLDKALLHINLGALEHNYHALCEMHPSSQLSPKVLAVVKSNAYGLGMNVIASYLESFVYGFAVSTVSEALHLRSIGIRKSIVVMTGHHSDEEYTSALEHDITLTIATAEQAKHIITQPDTALPSQLFFKIDTGMSRLGISVVDAKELLPSYIFKMGRENIVLMSHFACSDTPYNPKNAQQISRFAELQQAYALSYTSLNNSGGILHSLYADTYARSGIALYGGYDSEDGDSKSLLAVATLSAPVVAIRHLDVGDVIGYSATYVCEKPTIIAILGIGYSSGIPRSIAGSKVYINDNYTKILGVISMEMTAIDISHIPEVNIGDSAELFGEHIDICTVAKHAGTISYELFTHLNTAIRRTYT